MNLKTIYNKITKDTRAVSQVVATFVFIAVALIGAATVRITTNVLI